VRLISCFNIPSELRNPFSNPCFCSVVHSALRLEPASAGVLRYSLGLSSSLALRQLRHRYPSPLILVRGVLPCSLPLVLVPRGPPSLQVLRFARELLGFSLHLLELASASGLPTTCYYSSPSSAVCLALLNIYCRRFCHANCPLFHILLQCESFSAPSPLPIASFSLSRAVCPSCSICWRQCPFSLCLSLLLAYLSFTSTTTVLPYHCTYCPSLAAHQPHGLLRSLRTRRSSGT
jgi:hypothetical protein